MPIVKSWLERPNLLRKREKEFKRDLIASKPKGKSDAAPLPLPAWLVALLMEFFETKVPPGLEHLREKCFQVLFYFWLICSFLLFICCCFKAVHKLFSPLQPINSTEIAIITSFCTIFEAILVTEDGQGNELTLRWSYFSVFLFIAVVFIFLILTSRIIVFSFLLAIDWDHPDAEANLRPLVEMAFMFAYTWSICASINEDSQVIGCC